MVKKQTIFKAGNSLAVSLPARLVNLLGLAAGQEVICKTDPEHNYVTFEFSEVKQLSLLGRAKNEK